MYKIKALSVMSFSSILSLRKKSLLAFGDYSLKLTFLICSDWNLEWNSQCSVPDEKPFKIKKTNNSNTLRKLNISMSHSLNTRKLHFGLVVRNRDQFLKSTCWQTFLFFILPWRKKYCLLGRKEESYESA